MKKHRGQTPARSPERGDELHQLQPRRRGWRQCPGTILNTNRVVVAGVHLLKHHKRRGRVRACPPPLPDLLRLADARAALRYAEAVILGR